MHAAHIYNLPRPSIARRGIDRLAIRLPFTGPYLKPNAVLLGPQLYMLIRKEGQ